MSISNIVGSVETLVQVNVIGPLDWAELGPVIVIGRTPRAQNPRTTAATKVPLLQRNMVGRALKCEVGCEVVKAE